PVDMHGGPASPRARRRREGAQRRGLAGPSGAVERDVPVDVGTEPSGDAALALGLVADAERDPRLVADRELAQPDSRGELVEPGPTRRGQAALRRGADDRLDEPLLIGRTGRGSAGGLRRFRPGEGGPEAQRRDPDVILPRLG